MPLIEIRADFACDRCGFHFSVAIDPAGKIPDGWDVMDKAIDAVRGSGDYKGPKALDGFGGMSSVQENRVLCGRCTSVFDSRKG